MKIRITTLLLMLAMLLSLCVGCSADKAGDSMTSVPGDNYNGSDGMEGKPSEEIKPDGTVGEYERKIIRTVSMSCESLAFDNAISMIMSALETHGGYVESSSMTGTGAKTKSVAPSESYGQARRASYTLRVPAEQLDAFLNVLRMDGGIRILSQSMSSDEITGVYYDLKARLETLQKEEASLAAMLEGLTDYANISAMLEVRERLYNVIEEKEALQTKLNLYDSQVALSTVHLNLNEVLEYTEVEEPTFGERIGRAFKESWASFGAGCQNFAVWFVEAFPTLLIFAALATAIILVLIRIRRRRR